MGFPARSGRIQDSTFVGAGWLYTTLTRLFNGKEMTEFFDTLMKLDIVEAIIIIVSIGGSLYSMWRDEAGQSIDKNQVIGWAKKMGYMTVKELRADYEPDVRKALRKYAKRQVRKVNKIGGAL